MSFTHHQSIYSEGTVQVSGIVLATGSGKLTRLTKVQVDGTTVLRGNVQATAALSGLKSIASSGSATAKVACTLVAATSKILLTPIARSTGYKPIAAVVGVTAASSFRVILQRIQTAGTIIACKGTVAYMVIN